jgi:hypothetical protein
VSDNIRQSSLSRKAGRGLLKAFRALFGDKTAAKTARSWKVLKDEFRAGREEAEAKEPPTRPIPHREVTPEEEPSRDPGSS